MIFATALSIVGLGFLCWLVFTLAIYALPFLTGLSAACSRTGTALGRSVRSSSASWPERSLSLSARWHSPASDRLQYAG